MALRIDGTVVEWGHTEGGMPAGLASIKAIAAGWRFSLALRTDGRVFAWGTNDRGQCDLPDDLGEVTSIAVGQAHCLALRADGTVVAWGATSAVPNDLADVVAIAAGPAHSLALRRDGTAVAWGGQVGPKEMPGVRSIAAGSLFSLMLMEDGTIAYDGYSGRMGGIYPQSLRGVIGIGAGYYHGLAIVAEPPRLGIPRWGNDGTVEISLDGTVGNTYRVERSADLVFWHKLDEVTCSQPTETVSDPDTSGSARFYRAWLAPEYQ